MSVKSKKSHENYLLIDQTYSPGVPDGCGSVIGAVSTPSGTKLELAVYTCSHCQKEVIKNPARTRARGYCPNCDHVICDACDAIRQIQGCRSFMQIIDELTEEHYRKINIGEI